LATTHRKNKKRSAGEKKYARHEEVGPEEEQIDIKQLIQQYNKESERLDDEEQATLDKLNRVEIDIKHFGDHWRPWMGIDAPSPKELKEKYKEQLKDIRQQMKMMPYLGDKTIEVIEMRASVLTFPQICDNMGIGLGSKEENPLDHWQDRFGGDRKMGRLWPQQTYARAMRFLKIFARTLDFDKFDEFKI
jgi:hypothetical protein